MWLRQVVVALAALRSLGISLLAQQLDLERQLALHGLAQRGADCTTNCRGVLIPTICFLMVVALGRTLGLRQWDWVQVRILRGLQRHLQVVQEYFLTGRGVQRLIY